MKRRFLFGFSPCDYARMTDAQLTHFWQTYQRHMSALERLYVRCEIEARMRYAGVK